MPEIIPLQTELRPALPTVRGNVDYQRFETELKRIDQVLRLSGVDALFVRLSVEQWVGRSGGRLPTAKEQSHFQQQSSCALRTTLLKRILGESQRRMSRRLAECALFQWFVGVASLEEVRVPGKSQVQRYEDWLPADQMNAVVSRLLVAATQTDPATGVNRLGLLNDLELDTVWLDSTCVKANIHYPVDWVLLRDATRTLTKATDLIRRHGLKARMQPPGVFLSRMNRFCIAMSQSGKRADSEKARKQVLRQMKQLTKVVRQHALRHRDLLDLNWEETDWTRPQVEQVLGRIDAVLLQLPAAVKQAHERIIGGRLVANEDKLLSLYEPEVRVIVRGKAGAAVEFGNTLLIAEQAQGVVVDWRLYEESAPADAGQLPASLERLEQRVGAGVVKAMGTDRGFDSRANRELLEGKGIFNGLCPRGAAELKRRRHGSRFGQLQRRRAQTEGRIGILKNDFLGRPMRQKGYAHRQLGVVWSVLAHNVWVLARLEQAAEAAVPLAAAA